MGDSLLRPEANTRVYIHCKAELFIALDENRLIKCTWIVTSACGATSSSVAKEVEATEQLVRPANPQNAKLKHRHVIVLRHIHVQGHQLLSGQRMPGAEGAGGVHLGINPDKWIDGMSGGEGLMTERAHLFAVVVTASIEPCGRNVLHEIHLRTVRQEQGQSWGR